MGKTKARENHSLKGYVSYDFDDSQWYLYKEDGSKIKVSNLICGMADIGISIDSEDFLMDLNVLFERKKANPYSE